MGKHFVLTISREFGAEGHEIGKVLSERLGVKLYDKELLARAAAKSGVDVNSVCGYDENVERRFMDAFSSGSTDHERPVCKGILYHHRQVIRLCTSR